MQKHILLLTVLGVLVYGASACPSWCENLEEDDEIIDGLAARNKCVVPLGRWDREDKGAGRVASLKPKHESSMHHPSHLFAPFLCSTRATL
jgi:hypothetical protein